MTKEQAITYLYSTGMTDEQVNDLIIAIQNKPNRIPYLQYKPCLCGKNSRNKWYSKEGVTLVCKNCGLSVSGNNEADAKRRWNEYMEEGAE